MCDDLIAAHGDLPALMPLRPSAGAVRLRPHPGGDEPQAHPQGYLEAIARLRAARSDIAFTSDFIVGFPGETEEDFRATLALAEEVNFATAWPEQAWATREATGAAHDLPRPARLAARRVPPPGPAALCALLLCLLLSMLLSMLLAAGALLAAGLGRCGNGIVEKASGRGVRRRGRQLDEPAELVPSGDAGGGEAVVRPGRHGRRGRGRARRVLPGRVLPVRHRRDLPRITPGLLLKWAARP